MITNNYILPMQEQQQTQSHHSTKLASQAVDELNEARIESSEEFDSILYSEKKTRTYKKMITSPDINSYSFRNSIEFLLQSTLSQHQFETPEKTKNPDITQTIEAFNKTKTANIKAKNKSGKLYKEICPICLVDFDDIKGKLACNHEFCFNCIFQWSKTSTACPCCRLAYTSILKMQIIFKTLSNLESSPKIHQEKLIEKVEVNQKKMEFNQQDYYVCYTCGRGDNEHVLLICDSCDFYSCHIYCDPSLNNQIPQGQWFCKFCKQRMRLEEHADDDSQLSLSTISLKQKQDEQEDEPLSLERPIAVRTRSRAHQASLRVLRRLRRIN